MANGKWISGLKPGTPLDEAARKVFDARLGAVCEYLPLALHEADHDPEHVHQLRVATRRARAALRIFAACLPGKVHDKLRKLLRQIRRAAGPPRDWDVFLHGLEPRIAKVRPVERAGLDFLSGHAAMQRQAAQEEMHATLPRRSAAFLKAVGATMEAVRLPRKARYLRDLAQPLLAELFQELEHATEQDLENYGNLHQVRIAGKRVRYAMEVFECCFASEFRDVHYPAVVEMQEILGEANDSHVASQRVSGLLSGLEALPSAMARRWQPGLQAVLKFHQSRLPKQRQLFTRWWRAWRTSGGEKAFAALVNG